MSRPFNEDLNRAWKIILPAPVAGRIEYMLTDPVHNKTKYGARAQLIKSLLEWWIARESGVTIESLPQVPTLNELRAMGDA